ncbi:hypothetical protein DJ021_04775 [Phenylobacterium hankyongense]|uniref:Uncharacterized protein n=1 Tax=Phenylobacterium hankyongense TaxID=1813876 RepID=A0A328AY96_9CAUL|nr:hypothetical protein [Phenylobacterium hankyongense]RAK59161.1 hypothetical protein DJ021_04775 [Phenylobacterium hankyongense]
MRRALVLAALTTLAVAGSAAAETWTKFADVGNGTQWSYDSDYTYKDKQSGRLVVMQAISKPEAKLGPSGPGKADGVGSVVAIDCGAKTMISVGSYTPSKPLEIPDGWRAGAPKKVVGAENVALAAAVCPHVDHVPVK